MECFNFYFLSASTSVDRSYILFFITKMKVEMKINIDMIHLTPQFRPSQRPTVCDLKWRGSNKKNTNKHKQLPLKSQAIKYR